MAQTSPGRGNATRSEGRVTHRNVEALLGRLATDPSLRRRFADDPAAVLQQLQDEGFALTPVELDALAGTDPDAIRSFAQSIDRRIRRADHVPGTYRRSDEPQ